MFSNLMNLKFQRTWKQAVGFYFVYLLLIGMLGVLIDGLYSLTLENPDTVANDRIDHFIAVVAVIGLSITMACKKNALTFKGIFLVLLTGFLSLILGSLLFAMIPTAYLSTIKENT